MNADEYRKLADVEDQMWYFRALHAHVEGALTDALGDTPAAVLDAGCGTGGLILRLAPRHATWRWTGVDLDPLALELARQRTARLGESAVQIVEGSVTALPTNDASVEAIVSADVLYHLDDDVSALREFFRVLRPGGVAIVNVPAYPWLWSYHDVAVHARRRYVRKDVIAKASAAGFEIERTTYWNTLPFPLIVARRKLFPAPASGSDVRLYPAVIESAFNAAMALERGWIRTLGRLPFGSSVFAVLRKPKPEQR